MSSTEVLRISLSELLVEMHLLCLAILSVVNLKDLPSGTSAAPYLLAELCVCDRHTLYAIANVLTSALSYQAVNLREDRLQLL